MSNTEISIFNNGASLSADVMEKLKGVNDNLLSGANGLTTRRFSLKGGKFRELINGEQVNIFKDSLTVVIVDAAMISRTFYEGEYDPEKVVPPTCWSTDTRTPAPEVPEENRQATLCKDCPQNIKGSGSGNSRACRFNQRIAVALETDLNHVYQLQLPATSIFGDVQNNNMPMQAYAKFLRAHNTPAVAIVTEMFFDENAETPKLFFKPVRPLSEDELNKVLELKDSEETKQAITFTVAQTDKVAGAGTPALFDNTPKATTEATTEVTTEVAEDDEDIPEPKKAKRSNKPKPEEKETNLSTLLDEWDD